MKHTKSGKLFANHLQSKRNDRKINGCNTNPHILPYKKSHSSTLLSIAFIIPIFLQSANLPPTHASDAKFSDLNSNNPFFDSINYVQSQGIVSGYSDGTYKPDNKINRAEFVKIIIGTIYTKDQISKCSPKKNFPDISTNDWFFTYVCTSANNEIASGYPDGTFKPGNNINFAEASKIIINAFGYKTFAKDVWYQPFVEKMELLKAIPETICSISKNISRGEMAEIIYRLKEKITTKSSMSFFSGDTRTKQTTFVKSYRLKDNSDSYGIVQTSEGGYALTGNTYTPTEQCGYDMFWIKTDGNGTKSWSKLFNNCNSEGRAITQLTDGNYLIAGEVVDFRTSAEQEMLEGQGDNLVIKIDGNGNKIWARTVSQQSIDTPYKLSATPNGEFIMSGSTGILIGQADVADINHTLFLGNFSADGQTSWFKKIESTESMTRSVTQTKDGGYILIGNVKLTEENNQSIPALVKLNKNGTFEWATGLESVPMAFATVTPDGKGFTWGTTKMHLPFGNFFAAEQTTDNGYIALGDFLSATATQTDLGKASKSFLKESSFVGVKADSKGKLKWARTIKIKKYLEDTVIKKTKDDGYIIMGNNLVGGYTEATTSNRGTTYNKMMEEYYAKYPPMNPETPESKQAMQKIADYIEKNEAPFLARNIVLIKLDANFNYQWGKTIGGTKNLDGYAITQTTDSGYAIAGTWHTGIKYKSLGGTTEYTEAMVMKLDANGNLGNENGLIADFSDTEKSDVSSYAVTDKLTSPQLVTEYPMDNVVRNIKIENRNGSATTASEAMTYEAQICSAPGTDAFTETNTPPTIKTQASIKYDETKAIKATSAKGILINDELTPILNKVFNNEVKLWDDFAGGWVAYRFNRLVTRDDIAKIVTAMANFGYKIDSNANGDFTATKIGLTLNFHFKLGDLNAGQLDVMY